MLRSGVRRAAGTAARSLRSVAAPMPVLCVPSRVSSSAVPPVANEMEDCISYCAQQVEHKIPFLFPALSALPPRDRAVALAVRALVAEIRSLSEKTENAHAGLIRYQWWRTAVESVEAVVVRGDAEAERPPRHPLVAALCLVAAEYGDVLDFPLLLAALECEAEPLAQEQPASLPDLISKIDTSFGATNLVHLQLVDAIACGHRFKRGSPSEHKPAPELHRRMLSAAVLAGRAEGLAETLRLAPFAMGRGWVSLPADVLAEHGLDTESVLTHRAALMHMPASLVASHDARLGATTKEGLRDREVDEMLALSERDTVGMTAGAGLGIGLAGRTGAANGSVTGGMRTSDSRGASDGGAHAETVGSGLIDAALLRHRAERSRTEAAAHAKDIEAAKAALAAADTAGAGAEVGAGGLWARIKGAVGGATSDGKAKKAGGSIIHTTTANKKTAEEGHTCGHDHSHHGHSHGGHACSHGHGHGHIHDDGVDGDQSDALRVRRALADATKQLAAVAEEQLQFARDEARQLPRELRRNLPSIVAAETYLAKLEECEYDLFAPKLQKIAQADMIKLQLKLKAKEFFPFG